MNNNDYIRLSLELNLFWSRIMKEHSFFIENAFTTNNLEYKNIACNFKNIFDNILKRVVYKADNNISIETLNNNTIVTKNTLDIEDKTSKLTGIKIDTDTTIKELELKSGNLNPSIKDSDEISDINKQTLSVLEDLIKFKKDILDKVLSGKIYTFNYPSFIKHMIEEAKMYHDLLLKVENKEVVDNNFVYEQEIFFNNIMKEHALLVRNLLDSKEQTLINEANKFALSYNKIINSNNNLINLTNISMEETEEFKKFKLECLKDILDNKIKSIINPLLIDHLVREANYFLKILNNYHNL